MILRRCLLVFLLLLAVINVTSTYQQLSETADEGFHVFAGTQWWREGQYTKEPKHAPLARIFVSALPYFNHTPNPANPDLDKDIRRDAYMSRLTLMRIGILPFYLLSCALVYLWSRRTYGDNTALASLLLYITLAIPAGHGALATTDMAYTATFLWSLMAGIDWLTSPTRKHALLLGLATSLMIGSKFSALAQWPAAMGLIMLVHMVINHRSGEKLFPIRGPHLRSLIYAIPLFIFVLGLIYRFSFEPFFNGILALKKQNEHGFAIWLFGPLNNKGVWYFFPVVLFFKTPIPFQLLSILSNSRIIAQLSMQPLERLYPLLASIAILCVSMTSNINLGVRHVLPIYPLLSIPAGYALYSLWEGERWKRILAVALVLWQCFGLARSWPEYISYYNEFAGAHPEHVSLDSDFDWGQGIVLLDKALQDHDAKEVTLCMRKVALKSADAILHARILECTGKPVTGWVAAGRANQQISPDNFTWLKDYQAVQTIGSTIDLYYIPPQ